MLKTLAIGTTVAALAIGLAAPPAAGSCWTYRDREKRLARKINDARRSRGLPALRRDPQLSKVSRTHSYEMAKKRTLYHTPSSILGSRVTRWVSLGENVARTKNVRRAFRKMMRSSYHRANILDSTWVYFGVGTVKKNGDLWSTITFEAVVDPGTTLKMC